MNRLKIAVIAGTVRPGRLSIHAAKMVFEVGQSRGDIDVVFVDPEQLAFQKDGNNQELKIPEYSKITAEADGFFIVTPEYNHSFPGSLKRMLDSEFNNYKHKPVGLAGVSDGQWGGVRAIESLVPTLRKMGFVLLQKDVQFPKVEELFDENGKLLDEKYTERELAGLVSTSLILCDYLSQPRPRLHPRRRHHHQMIRLTILCLMLHRRTN
jgi:NAD(P)H-dependent FMN reductase